MRERCVSRWRPVDKIPGVLFGVVGTILFTNTAMGFVPSPALIQLQGRVKSAIATVRPAVVEIVALSTPANAQSAYQSIGSGVIVDPEGYILTNSHVVKDASYILVQLYSSNPTQYSTTVVNRDDSLDLALIKITEKGPFPYFSIEDSIVANVGDWVVAIGSPYGLDHSASMGVVSARGASLWIDGNQYRDLIQTDASVNQGNSGGPLIDLNGDIIGINTAIYAPSGAFAGIGFAISASQAYSFINALLPSRSIRQIATPRAAQIPKEKEPIRPGVKAPHPFMGNCTTCHTFVVKKQVKATPIAHATSIPNSIDLQKIDAISTEPQSLADSITSFSWIKKNQVKYVFIGLVILAAAWAARRGFKAISCL